MVIGDKEVLNNIKEKGKKIATKHAKFMSQWNAVEHGEPLFIKYTDMVSTCVASKKKSFKEIISCLTRQCLYYSNYANCEHTTSCPSSFVCV